MTARYLKFKPQDGIAGDLARGRIDVYEARGEYQLMVDSLEPQGHGALQFAFEQLKKKLARRGSVRRRAEASASASSRSASASSHRRPGAVIQDMVHILEPPLSRDCTSGCTRRRCRARARWRRSAAGSGSSPIRGWADVVIVARGGGSLEDLWTFNEEEVARAIASCSVPVISAIGHETDFTIADFVADLRAPTPSAAAELVICTREQLIEQIIGRRKALEQAMRYRLSVAARRLHAQATDRATTVVHRNIGRFFQRVDELERCLADYMRRRFRERPFKHRRGCDAVEKDGPAAAIRRNPPASGCAGKSHEHGRHTEPVPGSRAGSILWRANWASSAPCAFWTGVMRSCTIMPVMLLRMPAKWRRERS